MASREWSCLSIFEVFKLRSFLADRQYKDKKQNEKSLDDIETEDLCLNGLLHQKIQFLDDELSSLDPVYLLSCLVVLSCCLVLYCHAFSLL